MRRFGRDRKPDGREGHPIVAVHQARRKDILPRHTLSLSTDELFALHEAAYRVLHRPWGSHLPGLANAQFKLERLIDAYEDEWPRAQGSE